jgi:lactate racemase
MQKIILKKNAWYADEEYSLDFPDQWFVQVHGDQELLPLIDTDIEKKMDDPFNSESISSLASGKHNAIILIDDLSRPTPAGEILPKVIGRLISGGIHEQAITVLIAGGTHSKLTRDQIHLKIGSQGLGNVQVVEHDFREDCISLGMTSEGTPIFTNRRLIASEIKICIGSVYPHPIAGFSGGSKMAVLGAGGYETIRILHDQKGGTNKRTGEIDHPFRREINAIARIIGIDFCINLVLNQDRQICNLFAGDKEEAFFKAVQFVKANYLIPVDKEADIIISDLYPFDMDLQFGFDRGIWPFENSKRGSTKILLANCQNGIGGHELFPVSNPIAARIGRRLAHFHPRNLLQTGERLHSIQKLLWRRSLKILVLSPNITAADVRRVLPRGQVVINWHAMLEELQETYKERPGVNVGIYKAATLMLPLVGE